MVKMSKFTARNLKTSKATDTNTLQPRLKYTSHSLLI